MLAELSSGNPRLARPGATGQERGVLAELGFGRAGFGKPRAGRVGVLQCRRRALAGLC